MKNLLLAALLFISLQSIGQTEIRILTEWGLNTQFQKQTLTPNFGLGVSVLQNIENVKLSNFRIDLICRTIDLHYATQLKIGYQKKYLFGYFFFQNMPNAEKLKTFTGIGFGYSIQAGGDIIELGIERSFEKYNKGVLYAFKFGVITNL
jgi:hypothetical protein